MTDPEFDILDELYFVKSLFDLEKVLECAQYDLKEELWKVILKGWAKAIDSHDQEMILTKEEFLNSSENLKFIATKKGLLAHNQV